MANVQPTITQLETLYGHAHRVSWVLANTDIGIGVGGNNVEMAGATERSVQVGGTFGASGSVTLEGSNDGGVQWDALHDQAGAALTITAVGIKRILEVTGMIRPRVTVGDGTTAIKVNLCLSRPQ